jgi:hypothetical protein
VRVSDILLRIDELIAKGQEIHKTTQRSEHTGSMVDFAKYTAFRSSVVSFLERIYGSGHSYGATIAGFKNASYPHYLETLIEILRAAREEISGGYLFKVKALAAAEIFADFLEMSEHLLDQQYKEPAAVLVGTVLEEHLRQLAACQGIDTETMAGGKSRPKKAETHNSELAKADAYNKLEQKSITTWLDLRNKAAHGKHEEYTDAQVSNMLSGVREFVTRVRI